MFKPTAMLLRIRLYVQIPGGNCIMYVHQLDPHAFTVYTPSNEALYEWRDLCTALGRNPNTTLRVKAADWLEADVKIREALALPKLGFSIAPPQFDYVYSGLPNASLDSNARYTIQEVPHAQRAVSINTNRNLTAAQTRVVVTKIRRSPFCASIHRYSDSKQIILRFTETAWSVQHRLAVFAELVELVATT